MEGRDETLPDDIEALKAALVIERGRRIVAETDAAFAKAGASDDQALIAHLKLQIEKLNRDRYRPRSERTAAAGSAQIDAGGAGDRRDRGRTCRRNGSGQNQEHNHHRGVVHPQAAFPQLFPDHLPRERMIVPGPVACSCCGGSRLSRLGEDVTETPIWAASSCLYGIGTKGRH
jgi:hypothetical protein